MGRLATDGIADIRVIEQSLERLKSALTRREGDRNSESSVGGDALALARFVYVLRRIRDVRFGGDHFGEPAWDILLNLFIARMEGNEATVSSVGTAACVPPTTALRCITALVDDGLILRTPDAHDARRVMLTLSDTGCDRMAQVLGAMENGVGDPPSPAGVRDRTRPLATPALRVVNDG